MVQFSPVRVSYYIHFSCAWMSVCVCEFMVYVDSIWYLHHEGPQNTTQQVSSPTESSHWPAQIIFSRDTIFNPLSGLWWRRWDRFLHLQVSLGSFPFRGQHPSCVSKALKLQPWLHLNVAVATKVRASRCSRR